MACSNIRYGPGVTAELGMDLANMKAKNVGVYTDGNVSKLKSFAVAVDSMTKVKENLYQDSV